MGATVRQAPGGRSQLVLCSVVLVRKAALAAVHEHRKGRNNRTEVSGC